MQLLSTVTVSLLLNFNVRGKVLSISCLLLAMAITIHHETQPYESRGK